MNVDPINRSARAIQADICRILSDDAGLDAQAIVVSVSDGEVILEGEVTYRADVERAEELSHLVTGVTRVHNRLKVKKGVFSELGERLFGAALPPDHSGSGTKNSP